MTILKRLVLKNFRNYESLDLEFDSGVTILMGNNGQGKSNVLEAIYFISLLRSFRSSKIRNLYRWHQRAFMIRAHLEENDSEGLIALEYSDKRHLKLNGETVKRSSDFINQLYTVAFVPEDIDLVKGSASRRRRFLDICLSQLEAAYMATLQDYNKALKSRNQLLKQPNSNPAVIKAFDKLIINRGAELIRSRVTFFENFEDYLSQISQQLMSEDSQFRLRYIPSVSKGGTSPINWEERLESILESNIERDMQYGLTHNGPHRDDFGIYFNEKDLTNFGSEGQCRLSAIILKMAKAKFLMSEKNESGIILLIDDVIGELDENRKKAFFNSLKDADQVFLACTDQSDISGLEFDQHFYVENGQINSQ
jgi:DNA replication and repair protein RecF